MFAPPSPLLGTAELAALVRALGDLQPGADEAVRVDQIRLLEEVKAAAGAAQARVTSEFVASQRAANTGAGERDVERGIVGQVALAKRASPHAAARYIGFARVLTTELPHTLAALAAGRTTEHRAFLVARETVFLSRADRATVDAALAARLEALGDRGTEREARRMAQQLDPKGAVDRAAQAESQRWVSIRPAPDTMTVVSALLPVKQGVALYAALSAAADAARSAPGGDPRTRGQLMADTLLDRVLGTADAGNVDIEIGLVMTDKALFNLRGLRDGTGADAPATLYAHGVNHGPIPADLARRLLRHADNDARVWLRRLYTDPDTGQLVGMESRRRHFPPQLRRFLILRDQYCATPWCEAPIRHIDHVQRAADHGPTSHTNGKGRCARCNQTKEVRHWREVLRSIDGRIDLVITTPTGHKYLSRTPRAA